MMSPNLGLPDLCELSVFDYAQTDIEGLLDSMDSWTSGLQPQKKINPTYPLATPLAVYTIEEEKSALIP